MYAPLKCQYPPTRLHDAITQMTIICTTATSMLCLYRVDTHHTTCWRGWERELSDCHLLSEASQWFRLSLSRTYAWLGSTGGIRWTLLQSLACLASQIQPAEGIKFSDKVTATDPQTLSNSNVQCSLHGMTTHSTLPSYSFRMWLLPQICKPFHEERKDKMGWEIRKRVRKVGEDKKVSDIYISVLLGHNSILNVSSTCW